MQEHYIFNASTTSMSTLKQRRCSLFSQNWPNKLLSRILSDPLKITPKPINLAFRSQLNMICNKLRRPNSTPAGAPEIPQNRSKIEPGGPKIEPKLLQIPSGDLTFLRRWLERGYLLPKRRPKKPPRPPNLSQNPLQNPSKSRPEP